MSEEDRIFREVDEELRREQLAAIWAKYGVYILAGAALIVAVVGGYSINSWWSSSQAAQNGEAHYAAIELATDNKQSEALDAFSQLAADNSGAYRTLAQLEMAAIHVQEGRASEARNLYEQVSNNADDQYLRDFAALQAAALVVDNADENEMQQRLSGLIADTNPWRYSARELLALTAYRSGNLTESERVYSEILSDPGAPADLRRRAEAMMALMFKAPDAETAAPPESGSSPTQ